MITKEEYAQLSLYVYTVKQNLENRPKLPSTDWEEAEPPHPDNLFGFSYGIFRKKSSGEVVIAYTGSNEKLVVDFVGTNIPAGLGFTSPQIIAAAAVYEKALHDYGPNITLTGHSLGGGLASVMAVWYDRPAVTFDEAPFENTATSYTELAKVRAALGLLGYYNPALDNAISGFPSREARVTHYFMEGEVLDKLRAIVPAVIGADNPPIKVNGSDASGVQLHSQALLVSAMLSEPFRQGTFASKSVIPMLMDDKFYFFDPATSNDQNILAKFIRSEQTTPGSGLLTHLGKDLQKLGTNLAGLNDAAQKALIAQGIEWYYWQGTDYAGKEFFKQSGNLLQYTTAIGDELPGAKNKAYSYVDKWLTPIFNAHDEFYSPVGARYDQWNVVAGSEGATAGALTNDKTQLFIGGSGGDTFTGGSNDDLMLGGGGADNLVGGAGGDKLYGGADDDTLGGGFGADDLFGGVGNDTYQFTTGEINDTISDTDGTGKIMVDGIQLTGGKKKADNSWVSDDKVWGYTLMSGGDLIITRGSSTDRIVVQNWQSAGGNKLGLDLQDAPAAPPPGPGVYSYPGHAEGDWLGGGDMWGEATFPAGPADDRRYYDRVDYVGLGGNDILFGYSHDDKLDGGAGDDVIYGGLGSDQIQGGAGNDVIMSNINGGHTDTNADTWSLLPDLAPGATAWTSGATHRYEIDPDSIGPAFQENWLIKKDAEGRLYMPDFAAFRRGTPHGQVTPTPYDPEDPSQGDTVDAGARDDTHQCWRTRRASVPQRLRARGRGVACMRTPLHQHLGLRSDSVATANELRRSGTATRNVYGVGWVGEQYQDQDIHSMRVAGLKWLCKCMDSASSTLSNGVQA